MAERVTDDEQREIDALRRRAYGPDADIVEDPVALARLTVLEEALRAARAPVEPSPSAAVPAHGPLSMPVSQQTAVVEPGAPAPRVPRWHTGLVGGAAVVAVLLGGAAWSAAQGGSAAERTGGYAKTPSVAAERRTAGYEAGYDLYLDGLRAEVLALPGATDVAARMIRDQLKPYGTLYGRTVGAGPTADNRFCMIIADLPAASVTCISVENAYANPVSVLLPSWYPDADSDLFTGLGELVTYTLMPGGSVVAEYAARGRGTHETPPDAAAPTPTAEPPPGWQ